MKLNKIYHGDCLEVMKTMADNFIDAVVTDPPYGLSFMGKRWDYDVPSVEIWQECLRVLRPGGYLLSFAGTRTQHRMACNIEDAGFEIRDMIAWIYGSGFPKSLNIGKAVDKLQGSEREKSTYVPNEKNKVYGKGYGGGTTDTSRGNSPYEGWGTALKPALEPITVARKPLSEKTVAKNVLKWGTGGINIDGCRVEANYSDSERRTSNSGTSENVNLGTTKNRPPKYDGQRHNPQGRFPANLIHDGSDEVVGLFPNSKSVKSFRGDGSSMGFGGGKGSESISNGHSDSGSSSRFFYCAKASKSERGDDNKHPTVKPIALMEYLIKLVSREGATVLDPFAGSGSTGLACRKLNRKFILIEKEQEYCEIAKKRLAQIHLSI